VADQKTSWTFKERYAEDKEFRQQVDEGRKRRASERSLEELKESLKQVRGDQSARKKLY